MVTGNQRARGRVAYEAGKAAEDVVARHYEGGGGVVRSNRWRGHHGEIDLILEEPGGYVFVEVKKARSFAEAAERLTRRQAQRICNAALEFVAQTPLGLGATMRFDLALVDGAGACQIVENAFGEAGGY